jgi:galactitol-specific phosphotransferase system IIC component
MKETLRPHSKLAWAAIVLGLTFGIAGISHLTAVISVALKQGKPYDFRLVSLLATGGVLVYPGLINIGISRWIKQGHPWALAMSAVVTLPLLVYEALLVPARHSNQMAGVIINGLYLCFLIVAWVSPSIRQHKP